MHATHCAEYHVVYTRYVMLCTHDFYTQTDLHMYEYVEISKFAHVCVFVYPAAGAACEKNSPIQQGILWFLTMRAAACTRGMCRSGFPRQLVVVRPL